MQIIELGVDIHSDKVQAKYMQIIAQLTGINTVRANTEKGTVTIVGDVDPVKIIKKIRKAKMRADIIRVCPAVRSQVVQPYQHEVQHYANNYPQSYCYPPVITQMKYSDPYDNGGCYIL